MNTNADWLTFLSNLPANSSYTSTTVKRVTTTHKPLVNVSLDAIFELYGNLVLAGFNQQEALTIVVGVIVHGDRD
jgi:hypothetical protein